MNGGERRDPTPDEPFTRMADLIQRNGFNSDFGGAFVVVPPGEGSEPLSTYVLDPKQDPAQFWALLQTKAQLALDEIDQKRRQQQGVFR